MDAFALGLRVAHQMIEDNFFEKIVDEKYKSYTEGIGRQIVDGETSLEELEAYALDNSDITNTSDHLELIKAQINQYILNINRGV